MNAAQPPLPRRWPETARWGACFALALCFHAAGAAAIMARWNEESDLAASAPVIIIDLSPIAATPEQTQNDLPPVPEQPKTEPEKPVEKTELPPAPESELQVTPPPKPIEKPKEKQASLPTARSTAEHKAVRSATVANWQSLLVSKLERSKRYPPEARARREQGVAQLAFSIDRNGGVHNARIQHSSGSNILDREALQLLERAQPLPPPPAELPGAQIAIVVPIRYNIR